MDIDQLMAVITNVAVILTNSLHLTQYCLSRLHMDAGKMKMTRVKFAWFHSDLFPKQM